MFGQIANDFFVQTSIFLDEKNSGRMKKELKKQEEDIMGFFKRKTIVQAYDKENKKPVIKSSICNGEMVAGFKDIHTGKTEEIMLIKNPADLENFKAMYGIEEEITKEY